MTKRFRSQLLRQLSMESLAARVLCLALFAWTTVYTPLHLLLESHSDDAISERAFADQAALLSGDQDHSQNNHRIHSASDHKIRAACQPPASAENSPMFLYLVEVAEAPSPCFIRLFLVERVNPPGLDCPAPLLPRGPPIS